MKKLFILLLCSIIMVFSTSGETRDWSILFQLKDGIKDIVINTAKINDIRVHNEETSRSYIAQLSAKLENLKRKFPFDYKVFGETTFGKLDSGIRTPDYAVTVVIHFEDDMSALSWGFQTVFYPERIEFTVVSGNKEGPIGEPYNWLTYYKA